MNPSALYLPSNCQVAYQLNWSLSVFGKNSLPSPEKSIDDLRLAIAKDQLKILEFRYREPNVVVFFVSSRPQLSPSQIVRSIKGRWQYLARGNEPIEFRRNFRIESVGDAKSEILEAYVAKQTSKHPMIDDRVQASIEALQFHDPSIDVIAIRRSSYGEFNYALQIVIESEGGWRETRSEVLKGYRQAIVGSCRKHDWLLSRIGILSNHIHILLAARMTDSPQNIALSLMNNLAFSQGMKPMFRYSYYVGGFGAYDRGAIWNAYREKEQKTLLPPGQAGDGEP